MFAMTVSFNFTYAAALPRPASAIVTTACGYFSAGPLRPLDLDQAPCPGSQGLDEEAQEDERHPDAERQRRQERLLVDEMERENDI
jgi:hypothetical protein